MLDMLILACGPHTKEETEGTQVTSPKNLIESDLTPKYILFLLPQGYVTLPQYPCA